MRFTLVQDWPRPRVRPSVVLARVAGVTLGPALLLVAAAVAVMPLYSVLFPILGLWTHPELSSVELAARSATIFDEWEVPVPVQLVLAFVCFLGAVRLLTGRRHVVLFLRRFGHQGSTRTVSAAARRIGRRWRFVTLDDTTITPLGGGPATVAAEAAAVAAEAVADGIDRAAGVARAGARRLGELLERPMAALDALWWRMRDGVIVAWWLGAIGGVLLLGAGAGLQWVRHGFVDMDAATAPRARWLVESYVYFAGQILIGLTVGVPLALFGVAVCGIAIRQLASPAVLGAGELFSAMVATERNSTITLTTENEITGAETQVMQSREELFRPRLTVFKVDSEIWRQTVLALARKTDAILIDISEPTPNVLWEIEQIDAAHGARCVLIGEVERMRELAAAELSTAEEVRLAELSAGRTVLAYATDRKAVRRFRIALRRKLATVADAERSASAQIREHPDGEAG